MQTLEYINQMIQLEVCPWHDAVTLIIFQSYECHWFHRLRIIRVLLSKDFMHSSRNCASNVFTIKTEPVSSSTSISQIIPLAIFSCDFPPASILLDIVNLNNCFILLYLFQFYFSWPLLSGFLDQESCSFFKDNNFSLVSMRASILGKFFLPSAEWRTRC